MSRAPEQCCCGDDCASDYRVFVPCPGTVGLFRYLNVVMSLDQLSQCGIDPNPDFLYLYTPEPGDCNSYCGSWQCITDPDPSDSDNWCHPDSPVTPCPDCCVYEEEPDGVPPDEVSPGVCLPFRYVRQTEIDNENWCDRFARLQYVDDNQDGTCCDTRCENRSPSVCDDDNVYYCPGGDAVFPCTCTAVEDVSWSVSMSWEDGGLTSVPGIMDYLANRGDCIDNTEFIFKAATYFPARLYPVATEWAKIGYIDCPVEQTHAEQWEGITTWYWSSSNCPTPGDWCDLGYNGSDGSSGPWYRAPSAFRRCFTVCSPPYTCSPQRASGYSFSGMFKTRVGVNLVVGYPNKSTNSPVRLAIGYLPWIPQTPAVIHPFNNTTICDQEPCYLETTVSCPSSWRTGSKMSHGFGIGSSPDGYAEPSWFPQQDPVRGLEISLCAGMRGVWESETDMTVKGIPMVGQFDMYYAMPFFDAGLSWGKVRMKMELAVPDVPDDPAEC